MFKKCSLTVFALLIWFAPATSALTDNPTIAILRFGRAADHWISPRAAVLDLLESYGFTSSPEENRILEDRRDHHGRAYVNDLFGAMPALITRHVNIMVEERALMKAPMCLITHGHDR